MEPVSLTRFTRYIDVGDAVCKTDVLNPVSPPLTIKMRTMYPESLRIFFFFFSKDETIASTMLVQKITIIFNLCSSFNADSVSHGDE